MKPYIFLFLMLLFPLSVFAQSSASTNINLQVTGGQPQPNPSSQPKTSNSQGSGGIPIVFQIKNLVVSNVTPNSADISWSTNQFSVCQIFWGKTSEYEQQTISETNYATGHSIQLDNLDFLSNYHFKITCVDQGLEKDQTQDLQFKTLYILNNVSNLSATPGNQKIDLSWQNPTDANFNGIIILRSTIFYPLNIDDGIVVYQGYRNSFEDTNLTNGKTYYYTIFTIDKDNNYSSGAIASATPAKTNPNPAPVTPIVPLTPAVPSVPLLTISDFNFSANGKSLKIKNEKIIEVAKNSSLNISADCGKLSSAKSVIINIIGQQQTSSFILQKTGANNSCNVSLMVPKNSGTYSLQILIINSDNKIVEQINAELNVLAKNQNNIVAVVWPLIFSFLIIVIIAGWTQRRKILNF